MVVESRLTIRGCVLMALVAGGAAAGTSADAAPEPRTAIQDYVRARAADADGQMEAAARGYAATLALVPDDPVLATRTYRQAIGAGDVKLAVRAARVLDSRGMLPPDGRLLFVTEAVRARDWAAAEQAATAFGRDDAFRFVVPTLQAWIALGAKAGDPLALLDAARGDALASAYAGEHRALLLLATGRIDEGVAAIRAQSIAAGGRQARLRLAAAAIVARRDKAAALALLAGEGPALAAGRARLGAGKALPAPVDDPAAGLAELFVRVAIDINRERPTPIALALARMATILAPDSAETWLVTGELLASATRYAAAEAALARIAADDPFADHARDARLSLLIRAGRKDAALAAAETIANAPGATMSQWMRLGDVRASLDRFEAAAAAYGEAVRRADKASLPVALLLQGSMLEQAGAWQQAKIVLERARAADPDQPLILNQLGYAQLERRENMAAAQALIEQASRLRPEDASITDSLGWAYYLRGNLARAIPTLEKAATDEPGESEINEHLGDAYWTAGRRFEARYAWSAALIGAEGGDASRIRAKIDRGWSVAVAAP